jgi:hypothetical protein
MADTDDESEDTLTKQVLNMILENHALRDSVSPYLTGYLLFNVVILILLIYISVKISIR